MKRTVVLGWYGSTLDAGASAKRWERWRPTISLFQHEDLAIDRFELLHTPEATSGARQVETDIGQVSPDTKVQLHSLRIGDPWDFEEVYEKLFDFARSYPFSPDRERYLVHITTGTHVMQICWFLLAESRHIPGQLVQTSPRDRGKDASSYEIIDLDLSKYDRLARRFARETKESHSLLKRGIPTKNAAYNRLIERIERIALASREPLLVTGPTGSGKSQLARQLYELKRKKQLVRGPLIEVNCATIRGDGAMSALFGHVKGAYTGAQTARAGHLKSAHGGILFLDEIGELGLDEQAMLLRAVEDKRFLPVGTDSEVESDFELVAGTNKSLSASVQNGQFREDLLARLSLWHIELPALRDRLEDLEPNLDFELERASERIGTKLTMNRQARAAYLAFGTSGQASWSSNFRDLSGSVLRMGILAESGRIDEAVVRDEIAELRQRWSSAGEGSALHPLVRARVLDPFDAVQLDYVLRVCETKANLSEAGRALFAESRKTKTSQNDADRLKKYLARFELSFAELRAPTETRAVSR